MKPTEPHSSALPQGYVVPLAAFVDDGVTLAEVVTELHRLKWRVLAAAVSLAVLAGVVAFLMKPVYRVQVVLSPVTSEGTGGLSANLGELSSIAAIAGINIGSDETAKYETIATLKSRAFTQAFIEERKLLPVLFAESWDAASGNWADPEEVPTPGDGYYRFDADVREVALDSATGLVTLSIEWTDPQAAADWARLLVQRLNDQVRSRAVTEAERSLAFLNNEIAKTNVVEIRDAIYRVIESQVKAVTFAKSREEYALRVIDPPIVPDAKDFVRPKRLLMIAVGFLLGAMGAVAFVIARLALRRPQSAASGA